LETPKNFFFLFGVSIVLYFTRILSGYRKLRKLIPGLSRTSTDFQGLSSPGIIFFQFKDFPGFSRPVDTLNLVKQ
jgi:hypothetical protein